MDYYNILGVNKTATPDEIKNAYRKLASKHHPDKGGDTPTFQKIEEAYRILSDPEKRKQYDNSFTNKFQHNIHTNNADDINEIFTSVFGNHPKFREMFGERKSQFKQTYRTSLQVSLLDSYNGVKQSVKIQMPTGIEVLNIEVPKGIQHGTKLRYDNVLPNSILTIEFLIMPHLKYERHGNDLYTNHPISVLDLIIGSKFNFETLSGKTLEINVKPKTQPYMQLKIHGQGMPIGNSGQYGDQIILLKPFIPDNIDDRIIEAIQIVNTKNQ